MRFEFKLSRIAIADGDVGEGRRICVSASLWSAFFKFLSCMRLTSRAPTSSVSDSHQWKARRFSSWTPSLEL
jgi:hypothetical protein